MLFQAVMKFLSRLVEFKILINWGMVHSIYFSPYTRLLHIMKRMNIIFSLASSAGISPEELGGRKKFGSKPIRRLKPIERPAEEAIFSL